MTDWRTIARTDPHEAHEIWVARYDESVRAYVAHERTHEQFAQDLYDLGFRGQELGSELTLRQMERTTKVMSSKYTPVTLPKTPAEALQFAEERELWAAEAKSRDQFGSAKEFELTALLLRHWAKSGMELS